MSRSRSARFMRAMRRTHLYSALFLGPLVILYGVTAFLFNHPGAFSDTAVHHLSSGAMGLEGGDVVDCVAIAEAVARALDHGADGPPLSVSRARREEDIVAGVKSPTATGRLNLAPSGAARLTLRPVRGERPSPFDRRDLDVALDDVTALEVRLAEPLAELGVPPDGLAIQSVPVAFDIHRGTETFSARYDVARRRLVCQEASEAMPLRRLLTRLHVQHGFPAGSAAALVWALLVDVMAVAMLVWTLTGLLMWWHMRSLRVPGAAVMLLGAASIGASVWALAARF